MMKKVRKRKLNLKKLLILLLFIYLTSYGIYYIVTEQIRNIIITGNDLVKDYEIIEAAGIKNYPSVFTLSSKKIKKKIESIELVEQVKIKKDLKFRLHLEITENQIVFYNKSNDQLMLGNGKYIVNNTYKAEGIPSLINMCPDDILISFAKELGKVTKDVIMGISEIEYDPSLNDKLEYIDATRFKLSMNDGNIVYINVEKCESLKHYQEIYASLKNKKGILNLDSGNYMEVIN